MLLIAIFLLISLLTYGISATQLVQVSTFGDNPSGIQMFEYVPARVAPNPALLVAIHWCGGSAHKMFTGSGSRYAKLADQYGFIVVYPSAASSSGCWDVSSAKGLKRNGGGDSQGIVSMVNYEIQRRGVDPSKVYVLGASSGAKMTNVLMAQYPDVFAAGAVFAGTPFSGGIANQVCAAFPGYRGRRPRVLLVHGTADTTLSFRNLQQEFDQWSNVLGIGQTPSFMDRPAVGIAGVSAIRRRYGGTGMHAPLETITLQNGVHTQTMDGLLPDMAARFMGLIP